MSVVKTALLIPMISILSSTTCSHPHCMNTWHCFLHHARDPNCEHRNRDGTIESAVFVCDTWSFIPHTPTLSLKIFPSKKLLPSRYFHSFFTKMAITRPSTWKLLGRRLSSPSIATFKQHFTTAQTKILRNKCARKILLIRFFPQSCGNFHSFQTLPLFSETRLHLRHTLMILPEWEATRHYHRQSATIINKRLNLYSFCFERE